MKWELLFQKEAFSLALELTKVNFNSLSSCMEFIHVYIFLKSLTQNDQQAPPTSLRQLLLEMHNLLQGHASVIVAVVDGQVQLHLYVLAIKGLEVGVGGKCPCLMVAKNPMGGEWW
jgi:hypothetical protein